MRQAIGSCWRPLRFHEARMTQHPRVPCARQQIDSLGPRRENVNNCRPSASGMTMFWMRVGPIAVATERTSGARRR